MTSVGKKHSAAFCGADCTEAGGRDLIGNTDRRRTDALPSVSPAGSRLKAFLMVLDEKWITFSAGTQSAAPATFRWYPLRYPSDLPVNAIPIRDSHPGAGYAPASGAPCRRDHAHPNPMPSTI